LSVDEHAPTATIDTISANRAFTPQPYTKSRVSSQSSGMHR
jgi:hypothetical protein